MLDRAALAALGVDDATVAARRLLDGDRALAFLARLPELVARRQTEFGLSGARLMAGGALSAVLAATRVVDGRRVILKLSAAAGGGVAEAAALAIWNGAGACALLAASDEGAALLLDPIDPGDAADPTGDDAADAGRAVQLLELLRRDASAAPATIPDAAVVLEWRFGRARRFVAEGRAFAAVTSEEIEQGARAARDLHETAVGVLCHGDFLGKNILLDRDRRWWAIDPMPCIGDPCLDPAFWALHHRPGIDVDARCERVAAAAGLDPGRVRGWARALAAAEAALDIGPGRADAHLRALRG